MYGDLHIDTNIQTRITYGKTKQLGEPMYGKMIDKLRFLVLMYRDIISWTKMNRRAPMIKLWLSVDQITNSQGTLQSNKPMQPIGYTKIIQQ